MARIYLVLQLAVFTVLIRVLLAEEPLPKPKYFQRLKTVKELSSAEREYVDWAQDFIQQVMRASHIRAVRSNAIVITSTLSALAVTVTVGRTPTLVPALLGLITAAGQAVERISHDREQAHLSHQMAVKLQRVLREFHTAAGRDGEANSGQMIHKLFDELQQRFETIKELDGAEILKIRGQEPPEIGKVPS